MRIGISADSTCDLPKELIEKYDINLMPITVLLGDEIRHDGINITSEEVFTYAETHKDLPKTSAINPEEYSKHFETLKQKYDAIIHFSLSFAISSTGNNARVASLDFENVYVIDTKSLSTGSGLLVLSCADKINEGKDVKQIVSEIESQVEKVQASFVVDTLKFLHKGGRCSGIANISAKLLSIKPRISLVNGKMEVTKKYMGKIETSLLKYFNDIITEVKPDKTRAFVTYSSPVEPTKDILVQKLKDMGVKEVYEALAGATICTHCGRKTLGVIYIAE